MFTTKDYFNMLEGNLKQLKSASKKMEESKEKKLTELNIKLMKHMLKNLKSDDKAAQYQVDIYNRWAKFYPEASIEEARAMSAQLVLSTDPKHQYIQKTLFKDIDAQLEWQIQTLG